MMDPAQGPVVPPSPGLIPVVAGALVAPDGRVLLHRRAPGRHHELLWEFPGGKVEPGETAQGALLREIAEELDVVLDADRIAPVSFAQGAGQPHLILLYACHGWQGVPHALEWPRDAGLGGGLAWMTPQEIVALGEAGGMPPLDVVLAKALLRWLPGVGGKPVENAN